ncbi:hypothetical protein L2E82_48680 [Cichorium intybus]|uniref:Uncharacterized protein n=1 Tax=Cichorium intybus TaxID=13427 RepID=A0ACB8YZT8_CICIN|nr:hypothetical protein L2E82_48680 [Cichorium intybus]
MLQLLSFLSTQHANAFNLPQSPGYHKLILRKKSVAVKVKKGSYYMESASYVICNFELSLLPIKFNLPMVKEISNYIAPEVTHWQAE